MSSVETGPSVVAIVRHTPGCHRRSGSRVAGGLGAFFEELSVVLPSARLVSRPVSIDADRMIPSGTGILRSGTCCKSRLHEVNPDGLGGTAAKLGRPGPAGGCQNRSGGHQIRGIAGEPGILGFVGGPRLARDVVTLEGHGLPPAGTTPAIPPPDGGGRGVGDEEGALGAMVCGCHVVGHDRIDGALGLPVCVWYWHRHPRCRDRRRQPARHSRGRRRPGWPRTGVPKLSVTSVMKWGGDLETAVGQHRVAAPLPAGELLPPSARGIRWRKCDHGRSRSGSGRRYRYPSRWRASGGPTSRSWTWQGRGAMWSALHRWRASSWAAHMGPLAGSLVDRCIVDEDARV